MFKYLKGTIEEVSKDYFMFEVNNIGYKVFAPTSTISDLKIGKEICKIYTYVHMKEDGWVVYGFLTKEEMDTFELLITVSGIGPKVACSVLSSCTPSKFALIVSSGDAKALSKFQGIGAKTAQRIILELKDKVELTEIESLADESPKATLNTNNTIVAEVLEALISLGYSANEAKVAIDAVFKEGEDIEKLIKNALTHIYGGKV